MQVGLQFFVWGFFKKVCIADPLGMAVDPFFADPSGFGSAAAWLAVLGYSVQIYCDFSGYSNIARGVSKLFGIELMENFQSPYFSKNIAEFWRRWHISLSNWLKDYLFIPLNIKLRYLKHFGTGISLIFTFLLCGLWHGAAWTFFVWGFLHGFFLTVYWYWNKSALSVSLKRIFNFPGFIGKALSVLIVFHLVSFSWIFFRAQNFSEALIYMNGILSFKGEFSFRFFLMPAALLTLLVPLDLTQYKKLDIVGILSWPRLLRSAYYIIMILSVILLSSNEVPFIYFQF